MSALPPHRLLVPEEAQGERLDKFLAGELGEGLSRERLQGLILQGAVAIAGVSQPKASLRLKEGQVITVTLPDLQPLPLQPEALPLEIVYEDTALLVVNKPTGMLTHPTGREQSGTLVNALLHHCAGRLSGINGIIRPGIVHRLDRETSGLLVVAKTDEAHHHLSRQIQAKTARREYRALVQGDFSTDEGSVSAPIGRNPKHRDKMAILPTGRPATTHWRVLERLHGKFTLLQVRLETGRTHQIRVHMAHLGHPVLGDPLYGSGLAKRLRLHSRGQLLQAIRLQLQHPTTGALMTWELPQDPDITHALAVLQGSPDATPWQGSEGDGLPPGENPLFLLPVKELS